jgi:hypothetical protein
MVYLAYSSTLKMKVVCFSETSANFNRITRHYIAGDITLQSPALLGACFFVVSCLAYSSTLKMEVERFSITMLNIYQITARKMVFFIVTAVRTSIPTRQKVSQLI